MTLKNLKNLASLAATAQTAVGERQVLKLPLNAVKPKTKQVRKAFTEIRELADSLVAEGQIQPIIVSPKGRDGCYEIQKGERRWRACQEAGLAYIDAIINEENQTELDATAGELIENIQRDDLTAMEIAEALAIFSEAGWKQKDIAKRIGKTVPFVSTHLSLLKLPEPVLELYQQKITQDPETLNNLRQLHALNPARCAQLCQRALTQGISRAHSRETLNALKQQGKKLSTVQSDTAAKKNRQTQNKENSPDKETLADTEWQSAKPSQVRIFVRVDVGGEWLTGSLCTDRIDNDPAYGWVEFSSDKVMRVAIESIRLERIAGH